MFPFMMQPQAQAAPAANTIHPLAQALAGYAQQAGNTPVGVALQGAAVAVQQAAMQAQQPAPAPVQAAPAGGAMNPAAALLAALGQAQAAAQAPQPQQLPVVQPQQAPVVQPAQAPVVQPQQGPGNLAGMLSPSPQLFTTGVTQQAPVGGGGPFASLGPMPAAPAIPTGDAAPAAAPAQAPLQASQLSRPMIEAMSIEQINANWPAVEGWLNAGGHRAAA